MQRPKRAFRQELRRAVAVSICVITVFGGLLAFTIWSLPEMTAEHKAVILANFPPKRLQAVSALAQVSRGYAATNPVKVGAVVCLTYLLMQTFMVPGTLGLSLLFGALFGPYLGFVITALTSTSGSTLCYMLSRAIGAPLVDALYPARLASFQAEVAARRGQLLSYMLFLRVTPLLPNTFINMASPIAGVPLWIFCLGTLIGVAPNNFMAARAGSHISDLKSLSDLYDKRVVGMAIAAGCLAMGPVVWSWRKDRRAKLKNA